MALSLDVAPLGSDSKQPGRTGEVLLAPIATIAKHDPQRGGRARVAEPPQPLAREQRRGELRVDDNVDEDRQELVGGERAAARRAAPAAVLEGSEGEVGT